MLSNVFPERAAVQAPPTSISYSRLSPAFGVSITCIPISSFDVPGDAVGYPDALLAVEYCCAPLGLLVRHCIVELLRERELRPALALEGGAPRAPYRKRAAKHRSRPAPFTHQHDVPDGAFHVTLLSVGSGQLRIQTPPIQREPVSTSLAPCFSYSALSLKSRYRIRNLELWMESSSLFRHLLQV